MHQTYAEVNQIFIVNEQEAMFKTNIQLIINDATSEHRYVLDLSKPKKVERPGRWWGPVKRDSIYNFKLAFVGKSAG